MHDRRRVSRRLLISWVPTRTLYLIPKIKMAYPTSVNDQVTDAVAQVDTVALGTSPAVALSTLYQATAQALANAAHNSTHAQQQSFQIGLAASATGAAMILALQKQ